MGAGVAAHADEAMTAVMTFTPADFVEPSNAKLSVTVHNASDNVLENVKITQEGSKEGEVVGAIDAGKTIHFSIDVQITKKILDAGKVNFQITYKIGNKNQKLTASAKVTRVSNLASVTLTSRIFKTALYSGEITQAEYVLKNTGMVTAENAVVTDQAFGFTSSSVALAPGEEKAFTAYYAFSESAISSPRADFVSAESQNPYIVHAPSVAVHVTEDNLSFAIEPETVSVKYGDRAHFSVTVKNNGLLKYRNLSVTAEGLGVFPLENAYLTPGETASIRVETPPVTSSGVYPIQVSMRETGGSDRMFIAGEMNISVLEEEKSTPLISVFANSEGTSPFLITITGANRDIKDVRLCEKTIGEIKTFLVIKAGSETAYSPILSVNKGEAFEFSLFWDENGETNIVTATPVISRIASVRDAETGLTDASHASLYTMVNATHLPKIILIACLSFLLITLTAFIVVKSVKAKKRRLLAREQLGRTSKFAPIRTRDTEKEN
jgi:archaellum component FlaF (FlaF/FlaG flagellin family)